MFRQVNSSVKVAIYAGVTDGVRSSSLSAANMGRSTIILLVTVLNILAVISIASGDDIKHKRVIVKVPKKINHVHHHHVKKVHVYKHKPKPVHSVHVVEEEEPIGDKWKALFTGKHGKFWTPPKNAWKYSNFGDEEGYGGFGGDEEVEDENEDFFHKSGSQKNPTIWKGKRHAGFRGLSNKGRTSVRSSWKGARPKRQKKTGVHLGYELQSHKSSKMKAPKKLSSHTKSKKHIKKYRPYRPNEYDYSEYYDDGIVKGSPTWPERKEHTSWHIRDLSYPQHAPQVTEPPFVIENFGTEHHGEINLIKPDIKVVQAPQLGGQHNSEDEEHSWLRPTIQEPVLWGKGATQETWINESVQEPIVDKPQWPKGKSQPKYWKDQQITQQWKEAHVPQQWKDLEVQLWNNPTEESVSVEPVIKKSKKSRKPIYPTTEIPKIWKPQVQENKTTFPQRLEGFRTEMEHSGSGYTSHIGHNAKGDSSSYQTVRFGDKIKSR